MIRGGAIEDQDLRTRYVVFLDEETDQSMEIQQAFGSRGHDVVVNSGSAIATDDGIESWSHGLGPTVTVRLTMKAVAALGAEASEVTFMFQEDEPGFVVATLEAILGPPDSPTGPD